MQSFNRFIAALLFRVPRAQRAANKLTPDECGFDRRKSKKKSHEYQLCDFLSGGKNSHDLRTGANPHF